MRKIILTIFFLAFIVCFAAAYLGNKAVELQDKVADNSFVVLELFTSQGCSSCPAADAQLEKISQMAREKHLPLYALSFHVDYWDHLGWKDSFSDEKYTARQYQYGRAFSRRNIYTPQMIVNGRYEFVGSDAAALDTYINKALKQKSRTQSKLKSSYSISSDQLEINFNVPDNFNGFANLALVQGAAKINIKAGENSGRSIKYTHIVRAFRQIDCRDQGKESLKIEKPEDLSTDNMVIIVFLQNKNDMHIVAATRSILM